MNRILAVFLLLAVCSGAAAGEEVIGVLTYDVSFPLGDLQDYADKTSWRGFGLEGRWIMAPNVTLGLSWHWDTFYKTSSEMLEIENGNVSGNHYRILYTSPLMATAFWYPISPLDNPDLASFVGLGAGPVWIKRRLEIGVIALEDSNWHFGLAPEAGVQVPVGYYTSMFLSARYNYAFESGDAPEYQWWSLCVGFSWTN